MGKKCARRAILENRLADKNDWGTRFSGAGHALWWARRSRTSSGYLIPGHFEALQSDRGPDDERLARTGEPSNESHKDKEGWSEMLPELGASRGAAAFSREKLSVLRFTFGGSVLFCVRGTVGGEIKGTQTHFVGEHIGPERCGGRDRRHFIGWRQRRWPGSYQPKWTYNSTPSTVGQSKLSAALGDAADAISRGPYSSAPAITRRRPYPRVYEDKKYSPVKRVAAASAGIAVARKRAGTRSRGNAVRIRRWRRPSIRR